MEAAGACRGGHRSDRSYAWTAGWLVSRIVDGPRTGSRLMARARPPCHSEPQWFFFSSRRRHTRFKCDWSSDVCSSDLPKNPNRPAKEVRFGEMTTDEMCVAMMVFYSPQPKDQITLGMALMQQLRLRLSDLFPQK